MSQKVDICARRYIHPFLKSSLAVASLLVRYVNEEKAQKERGYKAPTYKLSIIEVTFFIYLKFTPHLWQFTFFCFSSMMFCA